MGAQPTVAGEPAVPRLGTAAYLGRLAVLLAGLACFALGVACTYRSHAGLGPWEAFHQGLSLHLPITFGQASILTGGVIVGLSLLLGVRPGVGTLCNMVCIGLFVDGWYAVLPDLAQAPLAGQIALDVVGVAIVGLGSGLYIKANLGAGPRDSLMLALAQRTGGRISVVRTAIELSALAFGFLMGATIGIGTLIHACGVGLAVEAGFRLFRVEVRH